MSSVRAGPCHSVEMPFRQLIMNVIFLWNPELSSAQVFSRNRKYPKIQSWTWAPRAQTNQHILSSWLERSVCDGHTTKVMHTRMNVIKFSDFCLSFSTWVLSLWGLTLLLPFYLHIEFIRKDGGWAQRWRKGNLDGTTWAPHPSVLSSPQTRSFYLWTSKHFSQNKDP